MWHIPKFQRRYRPLDRHAASPPTDADIDHDPSLDALARSFVACVPEFNRGCLAAFAANLSSTRSLDYSTLCAGTDVPVLGMNSLVRELQHLCSTAIPVDHTFACEIRADKQDFLKTMYPSLKCLVKDVKELSGDTVNDLISKQCLDMPRTKGAYGGFPCQDASLLSQSSRSASNMTCVLEGSLRTGSVFRNLMKYLSVHDLDWAILENVLNLARGSKHNKGISNLDACCHLLSTELDMFIFVLELTPSFFGRLTSRNRLYLLCVRRRILAAAGVSDDEAEAICRKIIDCLVGQPRLHMDRVLLPEGHAWVRESLRQGLMRPSQSRPISTKHYDSFRRAGMDWSVPSPFHAAGSREMFPGIAHLADRQIDILDRHHFQVPEASPRTLDVSMSMSFAKPRVGATSCLSSGSEMWIGHRVRMALGAEHLRLHGIQFPNEPELASFPGSLLRDLAGNSFDSSCCLAVQVTQTCLLAVCHVRRTALTSLSLVRPSNLAAVDDNLESASAAD